jgi:hypothetical protein
MIDIASSVPTWTTVEIPAGINIEYIAIAILELITFLNRNKPTTILNHSTTTWDISLSEKPETS